MVDDVSEYLARATRTYIRLKDAEALVRRSQEAVLMIELELHEEIKGLNIKEMLAFFRACIAIDKRWNGELDPPTAAATVPAGTGADDDDDDGDDDAHT